MTVSIKSPTSTTGSIQLNGSDVLTIESDNSVDIDSGTLHVDATNNRVGIGTSSPASKLHIDQGTGGEGLRFERDTYDTIDIELSESGLRFRNETDARTDLFLDGSGSVRIGTIATYSLNEKLALYGTSTANNPTIISDKAAAGTVSSNHILFNNANGYVGSVATSGSSTSFNTSSDYRLKENVAPMSGSIDRLKQLKPSTWSWVQDGSHGEGFIAHEAQSVVPEAVHGTKDEVDDEGNPVYQGIDQSKLVPLLTAALLEAIQRIEALEAK